MVGWFVFGGGFVDFPMKSGSFITLKGRNTVSFKSSFSGGDDASEGVASEKGVGD